MAPVIKQIYMRKSWGKEVVISPSSSKYITGYRSQEYWLLSLDQPTRFSPSFCLPSKWSRTALLRDISFLSLCTEDSGSDEDFLVEDDDDSDYGSSKKKNKKVAKKSKPERKEKKMPRPRLKATGERSLLQVLILPCWQSHNGVLLARSVSNTCSTSILFRWTYMAISIIRQNWCTVKLMYGLLLFSEIQKSGWIRMGFLDFLAANTVFRPLASAD